MATSVFDLVSGATYDIKVTYSDPNGQGSGTKTAQFSALAEFVMPAGTTIKTVAPSGGDYTSIDVAVDAAQPGWEIRVSPGTYTTVTLANKAGTSSAPIIVKAADPSNKPVITGTRAPGGSGFVITNSSYVYVDGFEVKDGGGCGQDGSGFHLVKSNHVVLQNNYVHDNGEEDIWLGDYSNTFTSTDGHNLIQNNTITNTRCSGGTGIALFLNPGSQNVIRGNTISGFYDNLKICSGDGAGSSPTATLTETTPHVLDLTGGAYDNHDTEVYDNTIGNAVDDFIEMDGVCVNARVYHNIFQGTGSHNALSIAPAMPGPYFVIRNTIDGSWSEGFVKMNTGAGSATIPARNVFFYHNTFIRETAGNGINMWYDVPGDHFVPVKNIVFKNNIFWNKAGGRLTSVDIAQWPTNQPTFDYNLWHTTSTSGIFEWWDGVRHVYDTFAQFQAGSGQEAHGIYGTGNAAIDAAVSIPGINDSFNGTAPDIGATEF